MQLMIPNNLKKFVLCLLIPAASFGQDILAIDSSGFVLKQFYLGLDVGNLWISGHHVNWETGEPDKPNSTEGIKTHCSAFVASACKRLDIYILRPPEHGQVLLSNAQYDWLFGKEAQKNGWKQIDNDVFLSAQQYANDGFVVVAAYKNPDDSRAGHIAFVMPDEIDRKSLETNGPTMIQAGIENSSSITLKEGFKHHVKKWPTAEIVFFYNEKQFEKSNNIK